MNDPIEKYLEDLASAAPTPGGGYAAAVTAAQGMALLEMSMNLTKAETCAQAGIDKIEFISTLRFIRTGFLGLAEEDSQVFDRVMTVLKESKSLPEDERRLKTEAASAKAVEVPFAVMEKSIIGLKHAEKLVGFANINLLSDVGIAADHLLAAVKSSHWNVRANARSIKDQGVRAKWDAQSVLAVKAARKPYDAIVAEIDNRWR